MLRAYAICNFYITSTYSCCYLCSAFNNDNDNHELICSNYANLRYKTVQLLRELRIEIKQNKQRIQSKEKLPFLLSFSTVCLQIWSFVRCIDIIIIILIKMLRHVFITNDKWRSIIFTHMNEEWRVKTHFNPLANIKRAFI